MWSAWMFSILTRLRISGFLFSRGWSDGNAGEGEIWQGSWWRLPSGILRKQSKLQDFICKSQVNIRHWASKVNNKRNYKMVIDFEKLLRLIWRASRVDRVNSTPVTMWMTRWRLCILPCVQVHQLVFISRGQLCEIIYVVAFSAFHYDTVEEVRAGTRCITAHEPCSLYGTSQIMIWCISPLCLSIINIRKHQSGKTYSSRKTKKKVNFLFLSPSWTFVIISFSYIAMLICVYLKVSCGLGFLHKLDFLLIRTLDGEELYTILPERNHLPADQHFVDVPASFTTWKRSSMFFTSMAMWSTAPYSILAWWFW